MREPMSRRTPRPSRQVGRGVLSSAEPRPMRSADIPVRSSARPYQDSGSIHECLYAPAAADKNVRAPALLENLCGLPRFSDICIHRALSRLRSFLRPDTCRCFHRLGSKSMNGVEALAEKFLPFGCVADFAAFGRIREQ